MLAAELFSFYYKRFKFVIRSLKKYKDKNDKFEDYRIKYSNYCDNSC